LFRYDSDDNPIIKKKAIEPLPPLDHSKIHYEPFEKNFYEEHEEIAKMSHDEIIEYRKALGTFKQKQTNNTNNTNITTTLLFYFSFSQTSSCSVFVNF
jgi:hypothetical protein